MKVADLKENPSNPRTIEDERLLMLEKSMRAFGDLSGIVFNRRTGQLVGGHQRSKPLPKTAEIKIETHYAKPTEKGTVAEGYVLYEGERFSYREVDWDQQTEMAANIAANKHGGDFDNKLLSQMIFSLENANFDMELTGFTDIDLKEFKMETETKSVTYGGQTDPDDIPEAPTSTKIRYGDIFQLGKHRLMCGDSTREEDVKLLMSGELADLVFTDPPYGVNYDGGHATKKRRDKLANDHSTTIYDNSVPLMTKFSKPEAALYLWFAATKSLQVLQVLQANSYEIRSWLIWNKNMAQFGAQYKQKHEPCLYCYKKGHPPFWDGPTNEVSVWDEKRASVNEFHPTQKPTELAQRAITNSCPKNGHVLDLFGGSGSTMIAAQVQGRQSFTMELEPKYCAVILKRWSEFTAAQPMHFDHKKNEFVPWSDE